MTAYELADWLTKEYVVASYGKTYEATVMLRKQADRIKELESKYQQEFEYVENLIKEKNEPIR